MSLTQPFEVKMMNMSYLFHVQIIIFCSRDRRIIETILSHFEEPHSFFPSLILFSLHNQIEIEKGSESQGWLHSRVLPMMWPVSRPFW